VPFHRVVDGVHFINTGSVGRPKDGNQPKSRRRHLERKGSSGPCAYCPA
jgi:hypothetical protein